MREPLKIVNSGKKSASLHMQKDEELLKNLKDDPCSRLHFYEWEKPSLTYGYFIDPEKHLNMEVLKLQSFDLGKRPTGGGITFHLFDLSFSLLLPASHPQVSLNVLENYAFINGIVLEAVMKFKGIKRSASLLKNRSEEIAGASHFCMAKPTQYDLMMDGKKVGGAAERLTKFGLLHQGTITLKLPDDAFLKDVLKTPEILTCMKKNSHPLLEIGASDNLVMEAKEEIKQLLTDALLNLL